MNEKIEVIFKDENEMKYRCGNCGFRYRELTNSHICNPAALHLEAILDELIEIKRILRDDG